MRAWITWETQRRNEELAKAFCCELFRFDFSAKPRILRYVQSIVATWRVVKTKRYNVIFAQYPSILLVLLLVATKPIFKFRLIVDAHNTAARHLNGSGLLSLVCRLVLKRADIVIISNQRLLNQFTGLKIKVTVLPDKIPEIMQLPLPEDYSSLPRPFVVLISTFAADEPIEEFLKGAQLCSKPFTLFITGRSSKAKNLLRYASKRVVFTDYLSQPKYDGLIQNADLLVDLTTLDNCLVCGAYEALAVGIPIILSDNAAARDNFTRGFLFAKNSAENYAAALCDYFDNQVFYRTEVKEYKHEFGRLWSLYQHTIESSLDLQTTSSPGKDKDFRQ